MPIESQYDDRYYARQVRGALRSARLVVPIVGAALAPDSVVDFGCGQGAWLRAWMDQGVSDVQGLDGTYIDARTMLVPEQRFQGTDLTQPCTLGRRYALAQSLEVAEHIPEAAAATLIASLVRAAPMVLFSAAVRGQGGESHVNEQPLEYWRALFSRHDFLPFDFLRPAIHDIGAIEPWYRYNTLLYVSREHLPALSAAVRASAVPEGVVIDEGGSLAWRTRRLFVSVLPQSVVNAISRTLARAGAAEGRAATGPLARDSSSQ